MTSETSPFHIGLLGCGTVGSAFAELIDERAGEVERAHRPPPARQRRADAQPRRRRRDLAGADLVVEVMGGVDPTRDYVLARAARAASPS